MIQGIVGNLSAGKTLTLAELGAFIKLSIPQATIYSNFHLAYPHKLVRSFDDFKEMKNGVLLADELWSWLDSYKSMDKSAQLICQLLLASAKRGISIAWSAQDSRQIHPRIYRVTSEFLMPRLHYLKDKSGNLITDKFGKPTPEICQVFMADCFLRPFASYSFICSKVFPLYNTREEIPPLEGLDQFKAVRAIKEFNAVKKAGELGIDLAKFS